MYKAQENTADLNLEQVSPELVPSFMSKDTRFRSPGLFSHCCKITGITNVLSLKQKQFGGELSFQNDALIII